MLREPWRRTAAPVAPRLRLVHAPSNAAWPGDRRPQDLPGRGSGRQRPRAPCLRHGGFARRAAVGAAALDRCSL